MGHLQPECVGFSFGVCNRDFSANINNINSAWSGLTYQIPNIQGTAGIAAEDVFRHVLMDNHDALWRFYRHAGDYALTSEHPSSAVLVASEKARLMRLIHESIHLLYDGRDRRITARLLLKQYRAYLDWERALPEIIALPNGISSAVDLEELVPHVLSLQYVDGKSNSENKKKC